MGDSDGGKGWIKWFIGILVTVAVGAGVPIYLANRDTGQASANPPARVVIPSLPNVSDFTKQPNLYVDKTSGPAGSTVLLSGDGFQPGEEIVFSMQATEMGRTKANSTGAFTSVSETVPKLLGKFPGMQFDIVANGRASIKHATAPFVVSG